MTPTKEDVVRALEALESMDDFARMDAGVDPIGPYKVLSDFIAASANLVAENERLKKMVSIANKGKKENLTECLQLRQQLQESQAREAKLRKALQVMHDSYFKRDEHEAMCEQALATPSDDTALRELIAGVYGECVAACHSVADKRWDNDIGPEAEECIAAIRALAEKAKGE